MRTTFGRAVVLSGGFLTLLTATFASDPPQAAPIAPIPKLAPAEPVMWRSTPEQPTPPKAPSHANQLKSDIEALRAERKDTGGTSGPSGERERLQARVDELLILLKARSATPEPPSKPMTAPPPKAVSKTDASDAKPVDGLQSAINSFRGNDLDGALAALKKLDFASLPREDRAYAQYLQGCCLRRANRLAEALTVFREVANSHDGDFMAAAATTQLSLIKSAQDLEAVLEQLRVKPKTR